MHKFSAELELLTANNLNYCLGFWTKLLVIGSHPQAVRSKCELLDLSDANLPCPHITNAPQFSGTVGIFMNNKAFNCGGDVGSRRECYSYNPQVRQSTEQILSLINWLIDFKLEKKVQKTKNKMLLLSYNCTFNQSIITSHVLYMNLWKWIIL